MHFILLEVNMDKPKGRFEAIDQARLILGLDEVATIKEIKKAYREKVKALHPDVGGDGEEIKRLNEAMATITSYFEDFPISFREKEVQSNDDYERHLRQFYDGWMY